MKIKFPNKTTVFAIALLCTVLACCIMQCVNMANTTKLLYRIETYETNSKSVYVAAAPMLASDAIYRLYECGGKIGIYDAKTEILIDIIDVFAATLPAADRQALKKGIEIYSFSELAGIIEDFST